MARELCAEINSRGHSTHIFTGAIKGSEPIPKSGLNETFILVKPLSRKLAVSSLWSPKLLPSLYSLIKSSDVIHIHMGRDLIPFLAAFFAIITKKPFLAQTHGMINPDGRTTTRLIDYFLTKPLIRRSSMNLALTQKELEINSSLFKKTPSMILPNGIFVDMSSELKKSFTNKIIFCSRLNKRKGLEKYIQIAEEFKATGLKFEIYGPDEGELNFIEKEIQKRNLQNTVTYGGSLPAELVQKKLKESDLLVLPSREEPFPMVILEAMAVGTSVLIMPSCGLAEILRKFNTNFVSKTEDIDEIIKSFHQIISSNIDEEERRKIRNFTRQEFSIEKVVDTLLEKYHHSLPKEPKTTLAPESNHDGS